MLMLDEPQHSEVRQSPSDIDFRYNAAEIVELDRPYLSSYGMPF
jgi:hypothetical protein